MSSTSAASVLAPPQTLPTLLKRCLHDKLHNAPAITVFASTCAAPTAFCLWTARVLRIVGAGPKTSGLTPGRRNMSGF